MKNVKWQPYCEITNKTIEIEFESLNYIDLIKIEFGNHNIPTFKIYGLNQINNWIIVTDCEFRKTNIFKEENKMLVLEKIENRFKKLKIIILNNNYDIKINDISFYK